MFFQVIKHEGVRGLQQFFVGFEGEEDLVYGILGLLMEPDAIHLAFLYLLVDNGGHHIILIRKKLVNGLLGNAQLCCDFIHGDGPDPIPHEEVGGFV